LGVEQGFIIDLEQEAKDSPFCRRKKKKRACLSTETAKNTAYEGPFINSCVSSVKDIESGKEYWNGNRESIRSGTRQIYNPVLINARQKEACEIPDSPAPAIIAIDSYLIGAADFAIRMGTSKAAFLRCSVIAAIIKFRLVIGTAIRGTMNAGFFAF